MNIVFAVTTLAGGGAQRVTSYLVNHLVEQGHCVAIIATFSGRGDHTYNLHPDTHIDHLYDHVGGSTNRFRRLLKLRRLILAQKPDLVITVQTVVNHAVLLALSGTKVPIIVSEHSSLGAVDLRKFSLRNIVRTILYRRASVVVAPSIDMRDRLIHDYAMTNAVAIANPVVLPLPDSGHCLMPSAVVEGAARCILSVGRLHHNKRNELAIEAFGRIAAAHPQWHLVILGEGSERAALEAMVDEHDLAERVHLPGYAGNLDTWYRRAEICVVPSRIEGFCNVIVEALSYDVATIAFDVVAGPSQVLDSGRRGILLPDDDHVSRLTDALKTMIEDDVIRDTYRVLGREVIEEFSSLKIFTQWEELIETHALESH